MTYKNFPLKEVFKINKKNINPQDNPEKEYHHYSIPAFDEGKSPVIETGSSIKSNKYLLKEDALLVSKLNPRINRVWKYENKKPDEHSICSTEFIVYEKKTNKVNLDFYYQYFNSFVFQQYLLRLQNGTTGSRMRVTPDDTLRISIPVPPLKEQQKIAAILSSIDEAIEKTEQIIEQTETVKKGLMQELLTRGIGHTEYKDSPLGKIPISWKVISLSELASRIVGGGTPSRKINEYYNGDIPWLTVKDLGEKTELDSTEEYITEKGLKHSAANLIEKGNIIVSTRMAVGKAVLNTVDMAINQDMKGIYLNEDIVSVEYFLYSYLNISDKILRLATGTTVKGIRLEQLKSLQFAIPPLNEQEDIVNILREYDNKLKNNNSLKDSLKYFKQGLMQQLLTGKKRVKVDDNEEVLS